MLVEDLPPALARDLPDVPGVRHRLARVGDVHLHFAEAGEGEAVVLQHGWPNHWYTWRHVIPELAKHRRVIVPDLRGFGWSEAPRDDYAKETLATDLLGLLDVLELGRVDLIAHDWGAFAGFLACTRAPERFKRFLAAGIVHPWIQPDPVELLKRLPVLSYQYLLAPPLVGELVLMSSPVFIETLVKEGSGRRIDPDAIHSYATRLQERARARATSALYRTFVSREQLELVRGGFAKERLTVPTRLLVGSVDPAIRFDGLAGYEDHADDMEIAELAGVGHFIPDEAPDEILAWARTFLGIGATPEAVPDPEPIADPEPIPFTESPEPEAEAVPDPESEAVPEPDPKPETEPEPEPPIDTFLHPEHGHVNEGLETIASSADRGAEDGAVASVEIDEPWEGYDTMNVRQISDRLHDAPPNVASLVALYETSHKNRVSVLRAAAEQ